MITEDRNHRNTKESKNSTIRWLIMALIALIAAGGGAAAWLRIFKIGLSFEDKSRIMRHEPILVVLHRSTFDTEKAIDTGDEKLKAFLSDMSSSSASFLIYSRKSHTNAAFAADIGIATGLGDRVHAYQFRPGNPFADRVQVESFIDRHFSKSADC